MKKIKKLLLSLMCLGMVICTAPFSVFADETKSTDINITTNAATISVTVPATVAMVFNADGTTTTPTNWTIENASAVDVKLTTISLEGKNDWSLGEVTNTTNSKVISMTLDSVSPESNVYTLNKTIAKTNGSYTIPVAVSRSAFSKAMEQVGFTATLAFTYND